MITSVRLEDKGRYLGMASLKKKKKKTTKVSHVSSSLTKDVPTHSETSCVNGPSSHKKISLRLRRAVSLAYFCSGGDSEDLR